MDCTFEDGFVTELYWLIYLYLYRYIFVIFYSFDSALVLFATFAHELAFHILEIISEFWKGD